MKNTKNQKNTPYYIKVDAQLMDKLAAQITNIIVKEKKYRDADYTAQQLQKELYTTALYVSAVFRVRFNCNYSQFVNRLRVEEAKKMLMNRRYFKYTAEDIGMMVGFKSRQSFYRAFDVFVGMTPRQYRNKLSQEI